MKDTVLKISAFLILAFSSVQCLSQNIQYIKVPELEKILKNPGNKVFVFNFWAPWCPPCVKEVPYFEKVSREYDTLRVKFIMVCLDFPSQAESQLLPFLEKNKVSLKVVLITDMDYNSWIDKVDSSWQGDKIIPL